MLACWYGNEFQTNVFLCTISKVRCSSMFCSNCCCKSFRLVFVFKEVVACSDNVVSKAFVVWVISCESMNDVPYFVKDVSGNNVVVIVCIVVVVSSVVVGGAAVVVELEVAININMLRTVKAKQETH